MERWSLTRQQIYAECELDAEEAAATEERYQSELARIKEQFVKETPEKRDVWAFTANTTSHLILSELIEWIEREGYIVQQSGAAPYNELTIMWLK